MFTTYVKPPTPWMTPEIMKAKTLRHNLERTWRRSRTHLDRSRYNQQCHLCNRMMTKAKSKYLADVIAENLDNPRRLWNSINNILTGSNHWGSVECFAVVSSERCAALSANTILSPQRSSHSTQLNVIIPQKT